MARSIEFIPEEKITKALEVFWEKGYANTSLNDLVEATQLNKSSLYNSFTDKHTLFVECLKTFYAQIQCEYKGAVSCCTTPAIEQLDTLIDKKADESNVEKSACFVATTCFEMANDTKVQAILTSGSQKMVEIFTAFIERAQKEGDIPKDKDATIMAHVILNSFTGFQQSYMLYKDIKLIKKMAEGLKAYLRA